MAVLSRARGQQAGGSDNHPMPREEPEMTYAQRKNFNRSGINARRAMLGVQKDADQQEAAPRHVPKQRSTFKTPTEFHTGPAEPGRVLGGPRRFDGMNKDTVGYMMSEEFLSSASERPPSKPVGGPQHVDNRCFPLYENPKPRLLVKQIHEKEGLDAPFLEHNNPKPPRDEQRVRCVKSFPEKMNQPTSFVYPPSTAPPKKQPLHGNARNDSKAIFQIYQGNPSQSNETKVRRVVGPQKWTAPEMDYPKRRPAIRPINSACTECHDVLGTERFGRSTVAPKRGVAAVDYPYKDQSPLLGFIEPQPQAPRTVKPNTLIRYFDPAVDDASKYISDTPVKGKAHPEGRAMNYHSNSEYKPSGGKAKGVYGQSKKSSIIIG